jgi:hypothetical protein
MQLLHQRLQLSVFPPFLLYLSLIPLRYTQGNDTYIFVPPDTAGAQSLTIHRSSGELVLNGEPHSDPQLGL